MLVVVTSFTSCFPRPLSRTYVRKVIGACLFAACAAAAAAGCSEQKKAADDIDWSRSSESRPTRPRAKPRGPVGAEREGRRGNGPRHGSNSQEKARPQAGGGGGEDGSGEASGRAGGDRDPGGAVSGLGSSEPAPDRKSGRQPTTGEYGGATPPTDAGAVPPPVEPPAALPGRGPRRPEMSADGAAEAAARALKEAQLAARSGTIDEAAARALEAYEMAMPHAATNRRCGEICSDATRLLDTLGRRHRPAVGVPTRFE